MNNDYLITLTSRNVYREVELTEDMELVRIGTTPRCDVRFRREDFFDSFEIELRREGDAWSMLCSDEAYMSAGGVLKLAHRNLEHGDSFLVKYAQSDAELFRVTYVIDFDRELCAFDREVDLSRIDMVTMGGGGGCSLHLRSRFITDDLFVLAHKGGTWELSERKSRYGVYYNGLRVTQPVAVTDKSFISIANFHFYFTDDKLICSRTDDIAFNGVPYTDRPSRSETSHYPRFNRNTRVKRPYDTTPIPILDPPSPVAQTQGGVLLRILPLIAMIAVMAVMQSMASNGGGFNFMSVGMMGIGAVTTVIGHFVDKRRVKRETQERIDTYHSYIENKENEIQEKRAEEQQTRERRYPAVNVLMKRVDEFSPDLFDRRPEDEDFLDVRLGAGRVETAQPVDYKASERLETDELAEIPAQVHDKYQYLDEAPVVVGATQCNAIGIVGPVGQRDDFLRTFVMDIVGRQYAGDVRAFFTVEHEHRDAVLWARNLPHIQNEELSMRNIACESDSRTALYEYLYKELTTRAEKGQSTDSSADDSQAGAHLVVLAVDDCGFSAHPVSRFVDRAQELGVTFVFFGNRRADLPLGCDRIIELSKAGNSGKMTDVEDDRDPLEFTYDVITKERALSISQVMAPVYSQEISLEATLASNITLFELLGIIGSDDLDLTQRWNTSQVYKSMAAPIGVNTTGVVELDLSDRAQGPHGLVAGTTGSGKSELLLTYILSMATLYHPYEVGFMIIDFKGGGMANQLADLPHLIGTITNIDGREIDRSLKSIRAELLKRQMLFKQAGVNHIDSYIKQYKAGRVTTPMPHLIMVVDEFAELKADHPEFMAELISTARIGRSLGVHLILATQKPAGQVSDQIWSNSRFKLCLKVQTRQDSNEVLKSPLAAEIKEPGRAYLQVGNNEVFELFQSAYSGAPEHVDTEAVHEFVISELDDAGRRTVVYENRRTGGSESGISQLDSLVGYVSRYCEQGQIERLPSICLPALADRLMYPAEVPVHDDQFALGIYDDPDNQYQGEAWFDLGGANTFVIGAAQTGKTNILQVMIRSIAEAYTPNQAWVYIMDFGSNLLKNFERLAHVGGVVISGEDEKVRNLFKLLSQEVSRRKAKLPEVGVSSYGAYLEAGYADMPRIFVMIDNFSAFRELYDEEFDAPLQTLCREGLTYGISFIITNTSTAGFGYRYLSSFSNFIDFVCNDASEYATTLGRVHIEPKNVPGRALTSMNKTAYEFQTYLAFEGEREIDRVTVMGSFVSRRNHEVGGLRAQPIPVVPDNLTLSYLNDNYSFEPSILSVAMGYASILPVRLDLDSLGSLAIVGLQEQQRESVMRVFLEEMDRHQEQRAVEAVIIDSTYQGLAAYKEKSWVSAYHDDPNAIVDVLDVLERRLEERQEHLRMAGPTLWQNEPYLVLAVGSTSVADVLTSNEEAFYRYQHISQTLSTLHVLMLFSIDDAPVPFMGGQFLRTLKAEARGLVITPNISEHKFYDISPMAQRVNSAALEGRQAFLVRGNDVDKILVATEG